MPESPQVPASASPSDPAGVTVDVEHRGGGVVLRVEGELDITTTPALSESITLALDNHPEVLVVDLGEVTFMGSAGLKVLVTAQQEAAEGTVLRVVAGEGLPARVLGLTGLDAVLAVYSSVEAAIEG